jgi:hypothetical protein
MWPVHLAKEKMKVKADGFDGFTKKLAMAKTRRQSFKLLATTAVAGFLGLSGARRTLADTNANCSGRYSVDCGSYCCPTDYGHCCLGGCCSYANPNCCSFSENGKVDWCCPPNTTCCPASSAHRCVWVGQECQHSGHQSTLSTSPDGIAAVKIDHPSFTGGASGDGRAYGAQR